MIKKGKNGKGAYVAVSKKIKGKKEKLSRERQYGSPKKASKLGKAKPMSDAQKTLRQQKLRKKALTNKQKELQKIIAKKKGKK